MANKQRYRVAHVEEALINAGGVKTIAAKILAQAYGHCTATTVKNYIARYPKLKEAEAFAKDTNLDLAESKLIAAINKGQDWAVKFYLETQGKHRGYTKRQEIAGVAEQPVVVTNAREWLTEQLDQMESRLRSEPRRPDGPAPTGGTAENPAQTVH